MNDTVNNQNLLVNPLPTLLTGITLDTFDCTIHLIINNSHNSLGVIVYQHEKKLNKVNKKMTVNKTLNFTYTTWLKITHTQLII